MSDMVIAKLLSTSSKISNRPRVKLSELFCVFESEIDEVKYDYKHQWPH